VTLPETGTTTYTWNADGTLLRKTDARGMKVEYAYDAYLRVTKKTPKAASGTVDVVNVVDYYYDTYDSYVQNAWGRLAATRTGYGTLPGGTPSSYIVEEYTYSTAGAALGKKLVLQRYLAGATSTWLAFNTSMSFAYDNEGRVTGEDSSAVTYGYDTMGRPYSGPGAALVNYGAADEVLTVASQQVGGQPYGLSEQRQYNTLGQMTRQLAQFNSQTMYGFQYTFPAAGVNNGRISQFKDLVTNEVVNYTYDAVNRLTGSGLSCDGFGNLLSGYSFSNLTVDGTTNRILNTGYTYDAAGNMTSAPNLAAMSYNPEGKMTQWGTDTYRYGPDGTRLMRGTLAAGQNTDVYFRDPWGRLRQVATYYRSPVNGYEQFTVGLRYDSMGKPLVRPVRLEEV
jgi:YD repeat-containing protein